MPDRQITLLESHLVKAIDMALEQHYRYRSGCLALGETRSIIGLVFANLTELAKPHPWPPPTAILTTKRSRA